MREKSPYTEEVISVASTCSCGLPFVTDIYLGACCFRLMVEFYLHEIIQMVFSSTVPFARLSVS